MDTRIVVLAKLPRPGLAKTRLIPALGAEGAARLAERLLREAVGAACAARAGAVELCLAPTIDDPLAEELAAHWGIELADQADGDLGARMADALLRGLASAQAVLLMGTDAPALDAAAIAAAAQALRAHDAALVPAADGGYALLGLKQPLPSLFTHMPWSTEQVAAITRQRLVAAELSLWTGPAVHDIDTPEDLCHVPARWIDPGR